MVTAIFNHQIGILETIFKDEVSIVEITDYIIATKENESYPRSLKILTDATDARVNFTVKDLSIIVDENSKSLEKYEFIIDAIILENPKETALALLYNRLASSKNYKFKIFSTREEASRWLESN